jgi:hypothetical protein
VAKLRSLVPKSVQPAVRRLYLGVGPVTHRWRMQPSFLVIGGQRCGTTSIFKGLAEHPQIRRPAVEKGTDYFTLHYDHSLDWYRGHFPLATPAGPRARGFGAPIAFEACTYYMFHPFALERIARAFPDVKLVVMLRDPVERAFSAYKHEFARGFETEPDFERALDLEDARLEGEVEKMAADVTYESLAHRHHAYRRRGDYATQLRRAFDLFPAEQVHVTESEAFFAEPERVYRELIDFLGLGAFRPAAFDRHNARPSTPMSEPAHARLTEYYATRDADLTTLLGRPPHWRI